MTDLTPTPTQPDGAPVADALGSSAPGASLAAGPATVLRARTRWAGIVWGLVLAVVAAAGVWLTSAPGRVDDLVAWVGALSPVTAVGGAVLVVGALLLVVGLVGLLRRAQRAVAARGREVDADPRG